ncbi:hypothetical protein [Halobaculum limi]|uniref:hypothetical protein n=1 Tax=Halobaculum limi TaxID=3031916 RepID=UPI002406CE5A|nr:hypothetical protein [Halobaculum sp. YSMS11]
MDARQRGGPTTETPVVTVQNAAIEHALTVGDAQRALALVGALDTLREESGEDPALTALSTTLVAWIGLREHDPTFAASPVEPAGPGGASSEIPVDGSAGADAGDTDHNPGRDNAPPAAVGAVVACERFGVTTARAASLAGCPRETVERVRARRSANDPSDER